MPVRILYSTSDEGRGGEDETEYMSRSWYDDFKAKKRPKCPMLVEAKDLNPYRDLWDSKEDAFKAFMRVSDRSRFGNAWLPLNALEGLPDCSWECAAPSWPTAAARDGDEWKILENEFYAGDVEKTKYLDELRARCGVLGMEVAVRPSYVAVVWLCKSGKVSSVMYESRQSHGYGRPRTSAETVARHMVERLSKGMTISWTRALPARAESLCEITTEESASLKVPAHSSAAELELRLAASGWTGNPFGPSLPPERDRA